MAEGIRTWSDDDGEWAACPYGDEEFGSSDVRWSVRMVQAHISHEHGGIEV